jgi:hypothetical protein
MQLRWGKQILAGRFHGQLENTDDGMLQSPILGN